MWKKGTCVALLLCFALACAGCGQNVASHDGAEQTGYITQTMQTNNDQTLREFEAYALDPANLPITFVYGGVAYRGFRGFLRRGVTDKTKGEKRTVTHTLVHPDGLLEATVEAIFYPDYGAYEWTVYFRNAGKRDTAVLSDLVAADMRFAGGNPVLKGNLGDYGGHFAPFEYALGETPLLFDASTGRSTQEYMPYFNVETDAGGAMIAIGWPGTWHAEFSAEGGTAHMQATGTTGLRTYLKPGECVQTPIMAFVRYYERNEDVAINRWRRWFVDCNMPYEDATNTKKVEPAVVVSLLSDTDDGWYRGGSEFENMNTWRESLDALKAHDVKPDYHWFDAGWYYGTDGQSLPDSWFNVGLWELDRTKWPEGSFKEYTTAVKEELGVKASAMWFEPERFNGAVSQFSIVNRYDTSWLLPADGENYLVNHGNTEAREWLFARITSIMEETGISLYREDHNFDPVGAFRAGDALEGENRVGITENKHFRGKMELWDSIIAWQKATGRMGFIEMQSSGGNRQDLMLLRRAVSFFRSDSDIVLNPPQTVSKVNALNKWVVYGGVLFGRIAETDSQNPRDIYEWRSAYASQMTLPMQFRKMDEATWTLVENGLEEYEQYQKYIYKDFYELTPWKPLADEEQWVARMYYDPETAEGVFETFTFPGTTERQQTIVFRGLDPDRWYKLTDTDGQNGCTRIKGSELMSGYDMYLEPRTASLIWIEPADIER